MLASAVRTVLTTCTVWALAIAGVLNLTPCPLSVHKVRDCPFAAGEADSGTRLTAAKALRPSRCSPATSTRAEVDIQRLVSELVDAVTAAQSRTPGASTTDASGPRSSRKWPRRQLWPRMTVHDATTVQVQWWTSESREPEPVQGYKDPIVVQETRRQDFLNGDSLDLGAKVAFKADASKDDKSYDNEDDDAKDVCRPGVADQRVERKTVVNSNQTTNKNNIFNWPAVNMGKMLKSSKQIQIEPKAKKEDLGYLKIQAAASDYWDFGGTWSSDSAGVWFDMDVRNVVGIEKSIPIKVSDRVTGAKSTGFMNKRWMAKANAKYGRFGPVSLFAINRSEKNVAVFVGFTQSQDNKDFITGMWTVGRNCLNNLDIHQSVFNIPDVLRRNN